MATLRQRKAITDKLDDLLSCGTGEENDQVQWLRRQLVDVDRLMLLKELERVTSKKGYRAAGKTDRERLGADAWLLDGLKR